MRKRKIFIVNDASLLSTGYGVYGKEILSRLHADSEKYEVAELGCYIPKEDPRIASIPWKFYPNAVIGNDNRFAEYSKNTINQFGLWRFNKCVLDFRPDIVFDVRDYWMYSYQELSPLREYFSWVIMPTVDSAPQKLEWLYTFLGADVVVPYTRWAESTLKSSCNNNIKLFPEIANAGINSNEFFPNNKETTEKTKTNIFGIKDAFVIGSVMRNQKRKLIADYLFMFRKYLNMLVETNREELYHKTFLYLHTTYPEAAGWDIPSLLVEYGVADKTFFSYVCKNCKYVFGSKFQGPIAYCNHCQSNSAVFPSPSNGVTTEQLKDIYNIFDIYIQYAICEGFGMPQIEAAACGVPVCAIDYSAMTEIVENLDGFKIPVQRMFRETETNADRAYPDIEATVSIIQTYRAMDESKKEEKKSNTRNLCIDRYTWDRVYSVWSKCFDSVDLSKNRKWSDPAIKTEHQNTYVPKNLKKYEFVKYVCDNIIKEPRLFYTGYIQSMLRDFNHILTSRSDMMTLKEHKEIIESLEAYLNNKNNCEYIRANNIKITEDFIQC